MPKRTLSVIVVVIALVGGGLVLTAQTPATGPAASGSTASAPASRPVSEDNALMAQSLGCSAVHLGHLREENIPARLARLRILLDRASRMNPGDVRIGREAIDLYASLNRDADAAAAARRCLDAAPDDYAMGLRWLKLAEGLRDKAEDLIELLRSVLAQTTLDAGIRAQAAADLAGVYRRQGDLKAAAAAVDEALVLDPYMPAALDELAKTSDKPVTPPEALDRALLSLRGNPRSIQTAWQVAQTLQGAGNYEAASKFYEYALGLVQVRRPAANTTEMLLVDYINCLLDSGQAPKAISSFESVVPKFPQSLALRALMVDAFELAGKPQGAKDYILAMGKIYGPLVGATATRTPQQAAEVAWYEMRYLGQAALATQFAKEAIAGAPDDPYAQFVMGACELSNGQEAGLKRLLALSEKDPYAAAIAARFMYGKQDDKAATELIAKSIPAVRSGPGWRALAAVAAVKKIDLPASPHAAALNQAAEKLPPEVLAMGQTPEKFMTVELSAPQRVGLAEPIPVTVTLTNTSDRTLSLGRWGLLDTSVYLNVAISGTRIELPAVTALNVPAPKYLSPGKSVSATTRIDVGALARLLNNSPMVEAELNVSVLVDPLVEGGRLMSMVPFMQAKPIKIRREAFVEAPPDKDRVLYGLGLIRRGLQKGDLAAACRAARQTGILLTYARQIRTGQLRDTLPEGLDVPILLAFTREFLKHSSPAVRAQMLASIGQTNMDALMLSVLTPALQDPDALVRLRAVELMGVNRVEGYRKLMEAAAKDSDDSVRQMAQALLAPPPEKAPK